MMYRFLVCSTILFIIQVAIHPGFCGSILDPPPAVPCNERNVFAEDCLFVNFQVCPNAHDGFLACELDEGATCIASSVPCNGIQNGTYECSALQDTISCESTALEDCSASHSAGHMCVRFVDAESEQCITSNALCVLPSPSSLPTPSGSPSISPSSFPTPSETPSSTVTPTPTPLPAFFRIPVILSPYSGNDVATTSPFFGSSMCITYQSRAGENDPTDTNNVRDIFLYNMREDEVVRISVDPNGDTSSPQSNNPVVSADCQYVAFCSHVNDLTADDDNPGVDCFVRNVTAGVTMRVSKRLDGVHGGSGANAWISADGRYVSFYSDSSVLVDGDNNGKRDIFIVDTHTGLIRMVSTRSDGQQGTEHVTEGRLSADATFITFRTVGPLVDEDTNPTWDIYLKNLTTNETELISVGTNGTVGNGESYDAFADASGDKVVFYSTSTNYVPNDNNGAGNADVFLRNRRTDVTELVSVSMSGNAGNGQSTCSHQSISADGRYVAFVSSASDLVAGDTNGKQEAFVRDMETGTTMRIMGSSGQQGNGDVDRITITPDGEWVAFESYSTNLGVSTSGGLRDVYVTRSPFAV